ncbi:MAG TPA: ROK family protein [Deinococcales bacterium]|nr:ROK family protein [Deinococcales bacterium]
MSEILLGLDLGGTKIAVAAVQNDRVIKKLVVPTPREGQESVFRAMVEAGKEVLAEVGEVAGIGVGTPGPIDFRRGLVKFAPNIPGFEDAPIVQALSEGFGRHVELENDANAAGLAEHTLGAGRGARSSVFLTVSTGIGGGIVINDRVWRGAHGIAGEVGHAIALPGGPFAGSGFAGALEAVAAGPAIARDATMALGRKVSTAEAFDLAKAGDPKALRVVDQAASYMGIAISNYQKAIDPEVFVIGGGVSEVGDFYLDKVRAVAEEYCQGFSEVVVRKALLGTEAGVIGAALAARP